MLGCWDLEIDRVSGRVAASRLCFVAREGGGVRLLTISGSTVASDESLVADGTVRPVTARGCRGTERAEWATSLPGIFRVAEMTCGSDTEPRNVSSLAFLRSDGSWIDVQVVDAGERSSIRVRRYRPSSDQTVPTDAGLGTASLRTPSVQQVPGWTAENIIEVSGKLSTEGIEAVVTELDWPIELKAKQLLAMADGGVHERVIDLLIGLTYPEKFVVRRGGGGGGGFVGVDSWADACDSFDVTLSGPCRSAAWGWMGLWDYTSFGYYEYYGTGPYWPYDGGGWYVPPSIGTDPGSGRPVRDGVVVNGQGYTQVSTRQPGGTWGGGSGSGGGGSGTGGTNSSSGVSSQGYSGGGGAGGGDRTAIARPPQ